MESKCFLHPVFTNMKLKVFFPTGYTRLHSWLCYFYVFLEWNGTMKTNTGYLSEMVWWKQTLATWVLAKRKTLLIQQVKRWSLTFCKWHCMWFLIFFTLSLLMTKEQNIARCRWQFLISLLTHVEDRQGVEVKQC